MSMEEVDTALVLDDSVYSGIHTDYCRLFPDCADPGVGAYR